MLINTGVLNWFGGNYDTDQQPRAPMDPNTFHVRNWCFWWFWISFFDRWFSSLFGQINISTPGLFAHIGCPWGLAFHPGLPCSCPPAWRCHQANTFDLYILCFMNNLNQGAEEALDDNRARGANCKVNIALFRSHFFINPSCSNPGGTLNEKPREVPTSCAANRIWVILSTGENWQWISWEQILF